MTNEKAFEQTLTEIEWRKIKRDLTLENSDACSSFDEIFQYFKTCAMALEKQIPKKPVEGFSRDYKCNGCYCTIYPVEHYCSNCGQAIDWSEEK